MSEWENVWMLQRNAPVRADAESMFVPTSELPAAMTGDRVVLCGPDGGTERVGCIVERGDDADVPAFRVALDPVS